MHRETRARVCVCRSVSRDEPKPNEREREKKKTLLSGERREKRGGENGHETNTLEVGVTVRLFYYMCERSSFFAHSHVFCVFCLFCFVLFCFFHVFYFFFSAATSSTTHRISST